VTENHFFTDIKIAFLAILGFEIVIFISSFFLCGLVWLQHDAQKSIRLFVLLMILFQTIAFYFFVKSLLLSRKKRREWNR